MTTFISRQPIVRVRVEGRDLTDVVSVRCSFGFDIRTAEAEVRIAGDLPSWIEPWQNISIAAGASPSTVRTRFEGFIAPITYELFPKRRALVCKGRLLLAERYANPVEEGTDLSNAGAGQTDQQMVTYILQQCGLGPYATSIGGTGRTLGTVARDHGYLWAEGETALSFIEKLDEVCLGYRTFETIGGTIVRQKISLIPATTALYTLTEGVDIIQASRTSDPVPARSRVRVTGYDPGMGVGPPSYVAVGTGSDPSQAVYTLSSPLIEFELTSEIISNTGLACQEIAEWLLGEYNRVHEQFEIVTYRDDTFAPGQTHRISCPQRLAYDDNAVVQNVTIEVDEQNRFRQRIRYVAGSATVAAPSLPPVADFTMQVEKESIVSGTSEASIAVVHCQDTSTPTTAPITTSDWTSTGGTPASGSGLSYTTVYSDTSGKSITHEVVDSASRSSQVTKQVPAPTSTYGYPTRKLYLAGTARFEIWHGQGWNTDVATGNAAVTVVANGPYAGAGALVMRTKNDLTTDALESTPFTSPSSNVTALWVEMDVDSDRVAAGSQDGRIALSLDGAATWSVRSGPDGNQILRVIIDRENSSHIYVLTPVGFYHTFDSGSSWETLLSAQTGETFRDVSVSFARWLVVMAGGRLAVDSDGTTHTFPSLTPAVSDVYAVTAHITQNRFFAYDSLGRTFVTSSDGGTAFTQRQSFPADCVPQQRGLWRSGSIPELLYIAGGTGGCWKSVDGFATSAGYYQIRKPGVGNAPSTADYKQIGAHALLSLEQIEATDIISLPSTDLPSWQILRAKSLWNGSSNDPEPPNWYTLSFDDSTWGNAIHSARNGGIVAGTDSIWTSTTPASGDEISLFRHKFLLAPGYVSSAVLKVQNGGYVSATYWINGTQVASWGQGNYYTEFTVDSSLFTPGQYNLLAIRGHYSALAPAYAWLSYKLELR